MDTKTKKLLWMFLAYTLTQLAGIILYTTVGGLDLQWIGESLVIAVFCFFIYRSYATHTKNVMKPLLGAILAITLEYELTWALNDIQFFKEFAQHNTKNIFVMCMNIIIFILIVAINVNHYKINATHHSTPEMIAINRTYFTIYTIAIVIRAVFYTFFTDNIVYNISSVLSGISDIFVINMAISIETSLDEFKLDREQNK